ncbi:MAG: hypothetical protein IKP76_04415 [Bacilli bacterium]|nr:hypothetical protein [Bacilli bacterium]
MESKNGLKNFGYLIIICLYAVLYLFYLAPKIPNYCSLINMGFIILLTITGFFLYKFEKNDMTKVKRKIIIEVFVGMIVYFAMIYSLGLVTGYVKNIYTTRFLGIISNILIPLVSAVGIELFRYMYMRSNKMSKFSIFLGTLFLSIIDCLLLYYIVDATKYGYFIFGTTVILPVIFKNILLSYLTIKEGWEACLIYSVPMTIYGFIVPVIPNLGDYLISIINVTFPSMLIIYASRLITDDLIDQEIKRLSSSVELSDKEEVEYRKRSKKFNIFKIFLIDIPLIELIAVVVILVSGLFVYHAIGVDTSAVAEVAQRGDAVIIFKGYKQSDYNVNDIVIYKANNKYIIDRISRKQDEGNDKASLYVKKEIDQDRNIEYRNISEEIVGVYTGFKLPKIAYPTIWIRDYLSGGSNEQK